ncbi:crystallin J1A-like [Liolophura sinensis]|uniref:crystallin J1A-like n=1 Tax=Liolophura sinensis TaxID=3198878 RepID=UPI0031586483
MATIADRRVAAVVGCAVADAAAQPLHWNYRKEKLDALLEGKEEIEFWEPSQNPFYCIPTGRHSCYGDQAQAILESLVECKGVNVEDLTKRHYKKFGPDSDYDKSEINKYMGEEHGKVQLPIPVPWRHASIKHFLKNYETKKEETGSETDSQVDCAAKIAPVVALYAGHPELLEKVEDVIRLTQASDVPVTIGLAAARLLEHYILHGPDPNALEAVIKELSSPGRKNPQDLDKAVAGYLRQVLEKREVPHYNAVAESFRKD